MPDYSVFDLGKIVRDSGGWTRMMITRGCPYNCHYCCNSFLMNLYPDKKRYFRVPSVDHSMKLIRHNLAFFGGIRGIEFDDDLLCLKQEWFQEFAGAYRHHVGLPYSMNARVETLTDPTIAAMKNSGCRIANVGVESGNPEVRAKVLNRHYTNRQMIETFQKLHAAGIRPSAFNMIGLPFETKEQMLDTLAINRKIKPYRGACFYFYPYPGTRIHETCRENGLLREGFEELSGYFHRPAIKLPAGSEKAAGRICSRLRLYLYLRRLLISLRLAWAGEVLYLLLLPFAGWISGMISGNSRFKSGMRRVLYRVALMKG